MKLILKGFLSKMTVLLLLVVITIATLPILGSITLSKTNSLNTVNPEVINNDSILTESEKVELPLDQTSLNSNPGTSTRATERSDIRYWATFQFDYHNTGNTSGKAPKTNNTLWKYKIKGEIYGSPVVVGNSVYFTATDGFLHSIDLVNGTENWKFDLLQNSFATPTVFGGNIYVGSGTDIKNNENNLFCIDGSTGTKLWSFPVDGPVIGAPIIINRPGNGEDRVYFGTINSNKVYSVNLATKDLDWEYIVQNGGAGSSEGIWGSLAFYNIENGWLLFAVNSESFDPGVTRGLFCINAFDKSTRWEFIPSEGTAQIRTFSSPTIFQDKVLIGLGTNTGIKTQGKLYCLNINTREILWNFTTDGGALGYGVATSPAVAYNKIIFGSCDGKLYALDYEGKELWNFSTDDSIDGIYSSPAVADEKVYFGSSDNVFYCLNVHNGSLLWKYDLDADGPKGTYGAVSAPAIAYNRVLMAGNNGYLYCFGSLGTEPPTIAIQKPANDEVVKDIVEISGVSDDDVEVTLVQVRIDDGNWINTTGKYLWSYSWDTRSLTNGPHKVYARAYDKDGYVMTNITLIVNNGLEPMLVLVTSHESGQIVEGITKFSGLAYHSLGIIKEVQINIDNSTIWKSANGTRNWNYIWDTREYIDGIYLIQFRAFDGENYSNPINLLIKVLNLKEQDLSITPMFRSNRNRTGVYNFSVPNASKELWNYSTENQIESSVVYYNGNIYFGSDDYYVYCLDARTGELVWQYETANQVRSTPVIADKRVYVGSSDYYFYCLNAQTGNLVWRTRTGGAIDSSAIILNNTLYFGSYDGKLYCLNTTDGSKIWSFETGDEIWGSPAYNDRCIYIGSINGRMYCVWANNGTARWNRSVNLYEQLHGIYSTPTITENKIIFGSEDTYVYCLDSATGDLIWKFKTTGYVYSSAAVNNSRVFISSLEKNDDGILYSLPLNDPNSDTLIAPSEVIWKFRTHDFDGGSSPVVSTISGKVLIGSNEGSAGGIGRLYCLDEQTGVEDWNFTVDGDIHGSPLLANGLVYIGSLNNNMYCLGLWNDSTNGGNGNTNVNKTQIYVTIEISETEVLSGHAIANIKFKATTKDGEPIPQAWFNFEVTKGALSDYYGTVIENGTYTVSFIAPNVGKLTIVTLTGTASKYGYLNGTYSINIIVKPLPKDDGDSTNDEDNILVEITKPKYFMLWIIITILLIITISVYGLLLKAKRKLKKFESGIEKEKGQTKVNGEEQIEERVPAPYVSSAETKTKSKGKTKKQIKNN